MALASINLASTLGVGLLFFLCPNNPYGEQDEGSEHEKTPLESEKAHQTFCNS